eukprot:scpid97186/ scgid17847/ 
MDFLVDSALSAGNPVPVPMTVRLLWLSAYLFIGKEGEPRVGSGCDPQQSVHHLCSTCTNGTTVCQFYAHIGGDDSMRRYLGLHLDDGLMDSVSVRTGEAQSDLQNLGSRSKTHKTFRTNFTVTAISDEACTKIGVVCYSLGIGNYSLSINRMGKTNLSRLHNRAAHRMDQKACQANPGPYYQEYGPDVQPSPIFFEYSCTGRCGGHKFPCPRSSFLGTTCASGRLKRTYPVGHRARQP